LIGIFLNDTKYFAYHSVRLLLAVTKLNLKLSYRGHSYLIFTAAATHIPRRPCYHYDRLPN